MSSDRTAPPSTSPRFENAAPATSAPFSIRPPSPSDRAGLVELVTVESPFTAEEASCALELIDDALANPRADYHVLVAARGCDVLGYVCYGPTPMTSGTWDLYWIATHARARGQGVASSLVQAMEGALRTLGARLVRVETSPLDSYGAAHRFYVRHAYPEVARVPDFYKPGDDLVIMAKRL